MFTFIVESQQLEIAALPEIVAPWAFIVEYLQSKKIGNFSEIVAPWAFIVELSQQIAFSPISNFAVLVLGLITKFTFSKLNSTSERVAES